LFITTSGYKFYKADLEICYEIHNLLCIFHTKYSPSDEEFRGGVIISFHTSPDLKNIIHTTMI